MAPVRVAIEGLLKKCGPGHCGQMWAQSSAPAYDDPMPAPRLGWREHRRAPAADAQGHPLLEVFLVFTEQVGREPPDDLCQLLHDWVREIERIVDPPAVSSCPQ